ncbi:MAG: hypothetical protein AMXMBFR47_40390 [Planctomycetota bacterium]
MNDAAALLDQARALGRSIAAHPRVKAFLDARDQIGRDPAAQKMLVDYQQAVEKIHQLEAENKPIEVGDKHRVRDLEAQMSGNEAIKALMRSQADYVELMTQVNRAMEESLGGTHA